MINRFFKSIMVGFCVFITTAAIAYIACLCIWNFSVKEAAETLSRTEPAVAAEATVALNPGDVIAADYYIARYDGHTLSIYACSGEREEFLYTLDARIEDISIQELEELKRGIVLSDKYALASFEEDFTS